MRASIASAELAVDIDIYSEEAPRALGITDEPAAVITEPRGYIGEELVDSLYELMLSINWGTLRNQRPTGRGERRQAGAGSRVARRRPLMSNSYWNTHFSARRR